MNNRLYYAIICFCTFFIGLFMVAYQQQWIIFQLPPSMHPSFLISKTATTKKNVVVFVYHQDRWCSEKKELLWPASKREQLEQLVYAWIALADEELTDAKKITLQKVLIAPDEQSVYISFDRSPLNKEWSTFRKWYHLESLLKTIRENGIDVRSVFWLVQHQPLQDPHLDCSQSWPIDGFIKN